jgi:carboxypeptidase family protein
MRLKTSTTVPTREGKVRTIALMCGAIAWLLAMPVALSAQTGAGSIAGNVKDSSGALLPGVTVEVSSPVLIEKVRTAVTDGEGQYKITELRPGTYTVTFILTGFSSVRRENVELTTGFTAAVNAELKVGEISETITVSGASPVVDIQNTKQQSVMTRDVIDVIPSGKEARNLAVLIPGMYAGGNTSSPIAQDVGGTNGQAHDAMTIHGGRQADQQLQVDGMSMQTWTRVDASSVYFTDGNFQEYAIEVAGNSADVESGGVRINLIPREGGNTFKANFFANYSSEALQSSNLSADLKARGLGDANRVKTNWEINPSVGGPIRKDKLWFFGTYTPLRIEEYVAGTYVSKSLTSSTYAPDLTQQAVDEQWGRDAAVRLTWQASQRNKISIYYDYNDLCHCTFLAGRGTSPEASTYLIAHNKVYQLTWSSPVTNRLLFDLGVSSAPQPQLFQPRPEAIAPRIVDSGIGETFRANIPMNVLTTNWSSRGSMSYVTGTHAVKVGYTMIFGSYRSEMTDFLGNVSYTTLNGMPTGVIYRGSPITSVNRIRPNLGLYGQDQWKWRNMTVNGGVRFDLFRSDYPDQSAPPTQYVRVPRVFPGAQAVKWKDLSPRIGASYDLFGNGKTALKASVNRFVLQQGTNFASPLNPIANNNTNTRRWTDSNSDFIVQGDPYNPLTNGELGPSTNANFGVPIQTVHYDQAWATGFNVRPAEWEFSTGVQHELAPRVSVSSSYFRRIYENFTVTDNQAVSPSNFSPYCVATPSDPRLPGGGNQQICGLFDLNPPQVGLSNSLVTAASNYGKQIEHWSGVDVAINARLSRVLLQGGLSTGKTTQDDCAVVTRFPEVVVPGFSGNPVSFSSSPSASAQFCHVETPFLTQVKLLGSYVLPFDVSVAATYQDLPGPNILANATYTSAQIASSLGRQLSSASTATINIVAPSVLYGERMHQLDLRLTKIIHVNRGRLQGMVDLYNALNANPVLVLNNTYGATAGATAGAAWQVPQGILPGRIIKFGIQANF